MPRVSLASQSGFRIGFVLLLVGTIGSSLPGWAFAQEPDLPAQAAADPSTDNDLAPQDAPDRVQPPAADAVEEGTQPAAMAPSTPEAAAQDTNRSAEAAGEVPADASTEDFLDIDLDELLSDELAAEPAAADTSPGQLRFSFSGAPWREVLSWLAEAGDLALYVDDVPSGSFTYSDSRQFSVDQAVAQLNMFLLPRGYTLVRRGKLLSVISLGDPRSLQQLDAMAEVAQVDRLDQYEEHEVVKCFVSLGEVRASDALDELQPLSLMITPTVLPKSNQLIITETAGKLRSAVKVLRDLQEPEEEEELTLRRFDLEHVDAETVLMVARTHLGIPEDDTTGIDITITTDLTGQRLFALGSDEKLNRLETLLKALDVPEDGKADPADRTLVSHPVQGDNLQMVYDVLTTVLGDQDVRLSIQESSNSVIALADETAHLRIRETIQELQAPTVDFEVVSLGTVDPYFAVSLIGEMFDLSSDPRATSPSTAPKVDADPTNRRLFVRGTGKQIQQIKQLIERLENRASGGTDMRLIPLTGARRTDILHAAQQFWTGKNRLQIQASSAHREPEVIERVIHPDNPTEATADTQRQEDQSRSSVTSQPEAEPQEEPVADDQSRFVSLPEKAAPQDVQKDAPPIRGQLVPNGLLLQSEDVEALDEFENHLRRMSSLGEQGVSPPVVYYLKYVTAEEAVKMLADLLDGGYALSETTDSLVRGRSYGNSTNYFGSFLFNRDGGATTVTAGTATIVSDARLNRLIVQGTKDDIAMVERYLKIVDKDASITAIETEGRSHVIELVHTKASEVAELIREAFPTRVEDSTSGASMRGRMDDRRRRGSSDDERRRADDNPTRGSAPKMAVAVHEPSNSLIITAPDALFAEVQQLVQSVDQRSEQTVQVISAGPGVDMETISQILAEQEQSTDRRRWGRR